jgi:hypothetical protein
VLVFTQSCCLQGFKCGSKLETLHLSNNRLAGVVDLPACLTLTELRLDHNAITAFVGLAALANLTVRTKTNSAVILFLALF